MLKFLAYFGLLADIATIIVFIQGMKFADFWSRQWILSIVLIIALFSLAMAILKKASSDDSEIKVILGIFGAGYTVLGIILYVFFAYTQTLNFIELDEYIGYWSLFSIMYIIGLYCVLKVGVNSLLYQSYAYGAATLFVMVLLIYKYVYQNDMVDLTILTQEIIILVVGSIIFFVTLEVSDRYRKV